MRLIYTHYGFNEFCIALGYKGGGIKQYFMDYDTLHRSLTVDFDSGKVEAHDKQREDWIVHLIDTGLRTLTGGRVKRLEPMLRDSTFKLTYGDGVADVNQRTLFEFHRVSWQD